MARTEESKIRLYQQFEEGLGRHMATATIEYLDTFATKQDVADVRAEVRDLRAEMRETFVTKVEFIEFKADVQVAMLSLESRLNRDLRTTALVIVGTNVALVCGAAALARFA